MQAIMDDETLTLPIYEFHIEGKIHIADSRWIDEVDVMEYETYLKYAHKYWKGKNFDSDSRVIYDILFEGKIRRLNKFSSLQEFESSKI